MHVYCLEEQNMKRILAVLLTFVIVLGVMPNVTFAALNDDGSPAHGKTLKDNGDGTYKLELSVTGDADYDAEPVKVNVVIVLDTSGSMDFLIPSSTGSRGSTATDGDTREDNFQLYRNTGGNRYTAISDSDNYTGRVYYNYYGRYYEYTGTRYSTTSRMDATKTSVNNLIDTLASQNTAANPDVIEMSLITFESNGHYNTPGSATANNWVSGTATSLKNTVNNLDANGGTNWDDALYRANALAAAKAAAQPDEKVYIVFFSDGEPTFSNTTNNNDSPTSHTHGTSSNAGGNNGGTSTQAREANSAYYHANQIHNATYEGALYGIFAFGTEQSYMKNVVSYGNYGNANQADSVEGELYFNANNEQDIENAFSKIATSIIEAVGITGVSMTDGTTNQVSTSTGVAELLEVDDQSFEYWLTWNISSDNKTFTSFIGGKEVECTAQASGDNVVITWEGGTATYEGTITGNVVKVKWTEKTDFYDFAPPAASFNEETGAVDWNLADVGTLLNEVSYSVSFDVYPSQETLDIIADIKNDDGAWSKLDPAIQKYIDDEGNLKTNTTAKLTYSDTRLENPGPKTSDFENPDPVENSAIEALAVTKDWLNLLEDTWNKPASVKLDVTRDDDPVYSVTLNNGNNWKDTVYVSIGIMGPDGKPLTGSEGHDFTFTEPAFEGQGFKWEINAPTVHPMLIENKVTMLVKVDEDHPLPSGATTYTFKDHTDKESTYYVDNAATSLTATNERRSSLNITKVVHGDDAPEEAVFPFTLNVVDPLAPESEPTNDPGHDSDYWIWFSVWDKDQQDVEDAVVSGAVHDSGSWYYGVSGKDIVLNVKAGYSIRVNNLPVGSTYTIEEGTLPDGFVFENSALTFVEGDKEAAWKFTSGRKSSGSIDTTNAVFLATFNNLYQYARLQIPVTKVLDIPEGLTGPKDITEKYEFTLAAVNNAPMPAADGVKVKNPDKDGGTAEFGEIVYMSAGTYTYTVTETGNVDGVDNDSAASSGKTVTVSVVENEDGTLTATTDGVKFTNTYSATGKAQIPVIKKVTGNDEAKDITGKFVFTLTGIDGAPMPTSTTVSSGKSGDEVKFGEITYSAAGTYRYEVTESYASGESYDTTGISLESEDPRTVSVVVTDKGDGTLSAVVNGDQTLTFNNPYSVKALDIVIPVQKILDRQGLTGPDDITGEFTFTLEAGTNTAGEGVVTPMPSTPTLVNPAVDGGTATFGEEGTSGKITVTAPGTYTYTVKESGSVPGVTNDANAENGITFDVVVTDNNDGSMSYTVNGGKPIQFTNTYNVVPTTAKIYVKKVLAGENAPDITGQYTFTLAAGTNTAGEGAVTPLPESATVTNPADNGGTTNFEAISFSKPGVYNYTITESGTVEGVVNDANATAGLSVTVTVTDKGDGTLEAVSTSTENAPVTFTNSYHETTISIPVTKTLKGAEGKVLTLPDITGKYTFTLTGSDGAPMPETKSYTNQSATGGNMTFGGITFKSEGTYTYTVTETNTGDPVPGVTNDKTSAKSVTIKVTRNDDGSLTAAFDGASSIEFVNTYDVKPVSISFPVKKVISKPDDAIGPEDITEKYTFTLEAIDDAPMPEADGESVKNPDKDGGVASFGTITYTAPGTYTYTVTESGKVDGVTNQDPASGTVTVTVTDNSDGTMTAVASSTTEKPLTFTNSYNYSEISVVLQVNKTIDAPSGVTAPDVTEKYTFTLAAKDDAPMPASGGESVRNPAADGGTAEFGEITFVKPGTYVYTVTESGSVSGIVNDSELTKTVTVEVVDGKNGELVPTVDYGNDKANVEFVNKYEVVDVAVTKTWDDADDQDGYRPEEITVNLLADGTKVDTVKVKADEDGKWAYTFKNVPKHGDNAKVITYTVTEEKVDKYETSISGDAAKGFTVTNKHTPEVTEITITKKWDDNNDQDGYRPTADAFKAKLHLMADGTEVKDAVAAVKDNGDGTYTVTYTGLPKKAAGKDIAYTVKEDAIDKYSANKTEVTAGETIVNTHTPETYWIKVTKIWDDESDKYGLRPDSVKFTVTGDNGKTYDVTMKGTGNTWNAEIEVLKYRDGGIEVKYSVDEEKITEGYTKKIEGLTITNAFKPCWGDPPVMKEVKGDKAPKAETFTFKLTAVSTTAKGLNGKMPMPEAANGAQEMTVDVKAGESKEFGKFDLVIPGVYTYTITEVPGNVEGYTYSTEKHTVVYTVTTNDDNSLKCVKTVDGVEIVGDETDKANVSKFKIINEYTKPEETPPTGDTTNLLLWGGMSLTSLLGLGYLFFRRKREDQ